MENRERSIVLGITASIAAFKACGIVSILRGKGYKVKCIMTPQAREFVTVTTLEVLTGEKVIWDMFERPPEISPRHISLAQSADMVLIAPATADIIGKIASGICDDIITCTVCSSAAPVVLAPAMNSNMYANPIVRDNIAYLEKKGYFFIGPEEGRLACGQSGRGCLSSPEKIVEAVENILLKAPEKSEN